MIARQTKLDVSQVNGINQDKWLFFLAVALSALATTFLPDEFAYLRYERSALMEGELWRFLSAHLTHLNSAHLLLNLFGLALICELLWGRMLLRHGMGLLAFSAVFISTCLWWLNPELLWYAGLSGVLHGLWAGCALFGFASLTEALQRSRLPCHIGALLLVAKLLVEFFHGTSASTAELIGGDVVSASHLYGALAGTIYVLILGCARTRHLSRGSLQQL